MFDMTTFIQHSELNILHWDVFGITDMLQN